MVKKGQVYKVTVGNVVYFERVKYVKNNSAYIVDQFGYTGKFPAEWFGTGDYFLVWEE